MYNYAIMYTMCPPGCYHNGFMVTPELGHRMYGYTLSDCIVESQECSNCMDSERNIQLCIQCALPVVTIMALWQLLNLGTGYIHMYKLNKSKYVIITR